MTLITINNPAWSGWKWGTYEKTLARVSSPGAKFRCAAKALDLETVRAYIRDGVDVNERSSKGAYKKYQARASRPCSRFSNCASGHCAKVAMSARGSPAWRMRRSRGRRRPSSE